MMARSIRHERALLRIWTTRSEEATQDQDKKSKDVLPKNFNTLEELWDFWDSHITADYEEVMEPVEVEIVHRDSDQPLAPGEASRFGVNQIDAHPAGAK